VTISAQLRQQIITVADYRCEYCKSSSRLTGTPLVMEHILPRSLGGTDDLENLAASCYRCNEFKGAKTHAVDPDTNQLVELFNPRIQA
jgi:5-methylcytosine-specific restriction endonuclease McrA